MTREEADFIKETLVDAIDWSSYADDYFKEKHNLAKDVSNVHKCIELLSESRTCENCKLHDSMDCPLDIARYLFDDNFGCNKWEAKDAK